MKNSILIILVTVFFTACGVLPKQEINFTKPKIQIPKKNPAPQNNKGSLYSMQGASLFADKKDLQVGDIIQINISESLSSDSSNSRELTSDRETNLGGGLLASTGTDALGSTASKINNKLGVGFSTNSSSSDTGEASSQFDESFETVISAIIQETYQNGNYFIKGSKELLIDGQKQQIIVSGVIRPYDITSDNSIESSQMANLKVLYDKEGEEADIMKTPWGTKIFRAIWPF
ncbi:flagellar basal body L-ring protein FlgH [Poseidonibacter ostreae]|jgi:flagellar L-ring protein FlgH|uniref:Flagellar L-ring protein n=1 Tax=Poseidonibacter ostreae TaxID=2654171 RepID=A0A6L4WND4_9BACT|nr:flagellar basal body L-ring protein FlgH [Poseidonibacter ostreae]KAB7884407.1 flagellar basal body L-ring protein FlgH [Poseidonibacter ostreae]KAB7885938.1 flagellar basal body L-ring protein FlgH [Poseidonibacter ostreae]KAB7886654.1 flagellar basal body L-ring protein FlgH [Poseidonibacter ostreae]MAC83347.1 flagellar biosynthesis protein FlgH [Arcobacter sp.]|tara:strand:+ start:3092 stop:3787 length:696 start_codon:yes stop_codon:yes gene_type:complete